jgi:hypothetical protein
VVAAAVGREDAVGSEQLEGAQVDLLVAAQGVADGLAGFREGGRIEDDEIVFPLLRLGRLEEVEDVRLLRLEGQAVAGGIGPGRLDRGSAEPPPTPGLRREGSRGVEKGNY